MIGVSETTIEERNSLLFFQIAEVLEFKPEQYDQATWGKFNIGHNDVTKMHGIVKEGSLPNENDSRWKEVECGTALCVAGHAANLGGYHPGAEKKTDRTTGEPYYELNWTYVFDTPLAALQGNNTWHNETSQVAKRLLGITEREAGWLFSSTHVWTAQDLRKFGLGESILASDPDYCAEEDTEDNE